MSGPHSFDVHAERERDVEGIRRVLLAAFPGPAEADLVDALRARGKLVSSLVASDGDAVIGTIQGTRVRLDPPQVPRGIALAPMAVHPSRQHTGVGRALIRAFLDDARVRGFDFCVVLGDPAYYERFGFVTSLDHAIRSTYDVPPEVFMAQRLTRSRLALEACVVHYEPEFAGV